MSKSSIRGANELFRGDNPYLNPLLTQIDSLASAEKLINDDNYQYEEDDDDTEILSTGNDLLKRPKYENSEINSSSKKNALGA